MPTQSSLSWSYLGFALVIFGSAWLVYQGTSDLAHPHFQQGAMSLIPRAEIAAGILILVVGGCSLLRALIASRVPEAMRSVQHMYADLESVRKEHYKMRSALELLVNQVAAATEQSNANLNGFEQIASRLERDESELQSIRQELARADEKFWRMQSRLGEHFGVFERTLELETLAPDIKDQVNVLLDEYAQCVALAEVALIRPTPGSAYDEALHVKVGEESCDRVQAGSVARCETWGLRIGTHVPRKATVWIASTEKLKTQNEPDTAQAHQSGEVNSTDHSGEGQEESA